MTISLPGRDDPWCDRGAIDAGPVLEDGLLGEGVRAGAAFEAGLAAGSRIQGVEETHSEAAMAAAVDRSRDTGSVKLRVATRSFPRAVALHRDGGHRFAHLEQGPGGRARPDEIFVPRAG